MYLSGDDGLGAWWNPLSWFSPATPTLTKSGGITQVKAAPPVASVPIPTPKPKIPVTYSAPLSLPAVSNTGTVTASGTTTTKPAASSGWATFIPDTLRVLTAVFGPSAALPPASGTAQNPNYSVAPPGYVNPQAVNLPSTGAPVNALAPYTAQAPGIPMIAPQVPSWIWPAAIGLGALFLFTSGRGGSSPRRRRRRSR